MGRELTFKILKYNPQNKDSKPHIAEYKLEETPFLSVFIALYKIRENQDSDLNFDFVCRAGICGSCGMIINGRPRLACRTLTQEFKREVITLFPMPAFKLIKDLSVDTGVWFNAMSKRVQSWIHTNKKTDISKVEEKIDADEAQEVFELDRCIECGCCITACGTKLMRKDFVGAAGLNRVARYMIDSHDKRSKEDFYELIGDDDGIFGCMSLLGCDDVCPKDLPLQSKIAYLRRKMVTVK